MQVTKRKLSSSEILLPDLEISLDLTAAQENRPSEDPQDISLSPIPVDRSLEVQSQQMHLCLTSP